MKTDVIFALLYYRLQVARDPNRAGELADIDRAIEIAERSVK